MARRDFSRLAGNKYSLRAKTWHIIKRIDFVSNHLGAMGDLLVTTWMGLIFSMLIVLGVGLSGIVLGVFNNGMHTLLVNIPAMLLISIGSFLVALNALMTNPSMGLQVVVSIRFLFHKINDKEGKKSFEFNPFRFVEGIESKSVLETIVEGRSRFLVVYSVRGAVSPVCFDNDLNELAGLNSRLLFNIERDTVLGTLISIQSSKVEEKTLPPNATEAMIRKRDINYDVTSKLQYNQQLQTLVVISAPNLDVLRSRIESVEVIFRQGLVIGYSRLQGEDARRAMQEIY
ncbi:hypothetical protein [Listeria booriae]|uniref:hypothetical protein n=1 Tax=Listeria booriae TaxID=1552123 RepID=UPI001C8A3796|nr:hypothetical protein [Listeria booriae]